MLKVSHGCLQQPKTEAEHMGCAERLLRKRSERDQQADEERRQALEQRKAAFAERNRDYIAEIKKKDRARRKRLRRAEQWKYSLHKQALKRGIAVPPEEYGTWWAEDKHKPLCQLFRVQLFKRLTREYRKRNPLNFSEMGQGHRRHNRDILCYMVAKVLRISQTEANIFCRVYEECMEEVLFQYGYVIFHNFGCMYLSVHSAKVVRGADGTPRPIYNKLRISFKVARRLNRAKLRMLEMSRKVTALEKELAIEVAAMDEYTIRRKLHNQIPI